MPTRDRRRDPDVIRYLEVDLATFDAWVQYGLVELEQYLAKYARFYELYG